MIKQFYFYIFKMKLYQNFLIDINKIKFLLDSAIVN